jgi:ELWxxDGT repeat protein
MNLETTNWRWLLWALPWLGLTLSAPPTRAFERRAPLVELPGKPIENASYVPFEGGVVFEGEDEGGGVELWWTDGTPAGTRRLTDIQPGLLHGLCPDVDGADPVFVSDGALYFFGRAADKIDLWRLRWGEQPERVRELGLPCQQLDPYELDVVVRDDTDHLFVLAPSLRPGSSVPEPAVWRIHLPSGDVELMAFAPSGWHLGGVDSLWNDDVYVRLRSQGGDTAAYARIDEVGQRVDIAFTNDWYPHASGTYQGRRILGGQRLYITDGTTQGTATLTSTGVFSVEPGFEWNGVYYFSAAFRTLEDELWRTDGTPEGTRVVRNLSGAGPGIDGQPVVFDDRIVFYRQGSGLSDNSELFESDGTAEGTFAHVFVGDRSEIRLANDGDTTTLLLLGDHLYLLAASDTADRSAALWRIAPGTRRVQQISAPTLDDSNVTDLAHVNGQFLIRDEPDGTSRLLATGDVFSDGFEVGSLQ